MGSMNVKMKMMPSSPEVDLEEIKESVKKILEEKHGVNKVAFDEEPIAFGLKAIVLFFIWPEDKELENVENELGEIENVNSLEVLDIRRAL
jgi:elongation factor 1-beta